MISASQVKELRESTGAGMLDCKKALEATNGDMDAAVDWLREKGISKAAKKADRIAAEGLAKITIDGNVASIIEVNSETDFVAKNSEFTDMVALIGKAIVDNDVKTMEEAMKLPTSEGTIEELIVAKTAKIGEKLSFRRFARVVKNDNDSLMPLLKWAKNSIFVDSKSSKKKKVNSFTPTSIWVVRLLFLQYLMEQVVM